jgi:hypothetical protein
MLGKSHAAIIVRGAAEPATEACRPGSTERHFGAVASVDLDCHSGPLLRTSRHHLKPLQS